MKVDVSIIIVNWKTKDFVRNCIPSIQRETVGINYEIVVVDNASYDGCDEMLGKDYPSARYVQSSLNLGFAGANNLGFREAKGAALLFLNPDTVIHDHAITRLLTRLHSLPDAGAVGARLLNTDLSFQTSCIKAYPTIFNQMLVSEALQQRFPMWRLWGMAAGFRSSCEPAEVEVVSGACIMIKRSVFERIGGFSEQYFMYSEDVDLCLMCGQSGLRNYYVPDAIIVHHGGGGSSQAGGSAFSNVMFSESRYHYFLKNRGAAYALAYRFCVTFSGIVRLAIAALALLFLWEASARKQWLGSIKKWHIIIAWSLGWKKARSSA
jgi:GT2 family glycosyltransferase